MRAFSSFFIVLAFTWALPAGEIDQVEAFALAKDRSEFLKTLFQEQNRTISTTVCICSRPKNLTSAWNSPKRGMPAMVKPPY